MSNRFQLNQEDVKRIIKDFLIFSAPIILGALLLLQAGADWKVVYGMIYSSLLTSVINILRKFIATNQ